MVSPWPVDDPVQDPVVPRLAAAHLSIQAMRRVSLVAQVIAAIGVLAWAILICVDWSEVPGGAPWQQQADILLAPTTILLAAVSVGVLGTAGRAASAWMALRLVIRPVVSTGEAADPYEEL